MEHQIQNEIILTKIKEIGQATFFCYNESSQKMPVAIIKHLDFEDDTTLHFTCQFLPLTEQSWTVFGGELYCYKKGMPYSFILHGVAESHLSKGNITFTIKYIESFGKINVEENNQSVFSVFIKPYRYIFQKGAAIIGAFKKKESVLPLNNAAA
jgi:hypothetical protein